MIIPTEPADTSTQASSEGLARWWRGIQPTLAAQLPVTIAENLFTSSKYVAVENPDLRTFDPAAFIAAIGATVVLASLTRAQVDDIDAAVARHRDGGDEARAAKVAALRASAPALLSVDMLLLCPQHRDVRIIANAAEDEDVWPENDDNDATTHKPMRSVDPAFPSQDEVAEAVTAARDAIVADDAMCSNGDARSVDTEHLKGTFPTYQSWGLDVPPDLLRAMTNEVRSRHVALIDALSAELVDEFIEQVTPALAASKSVEKLITGAKLLLSTRIACNCLTRNTAKGLAREAKLRAKTQLAGGA